MPMKRFSELPEFVLFLFTVLVPVMVMSTVVIGIQQQESNPSTKSFKLR